MLSGKDGRSWAPFRGQEAHPLAPQPRYATRNLVASAGRARRVLARLTTRSMRTLVRSLGGAVSTWELED
jgi:hypothetical protein